MSDKPIQFSQEKNEKLKLERDISFDEILALINSGGLVNITSHPNQIKYPHQQIYIILKEETVYMVPFVEDDEKIFLKTIIPSSKLKKKYLSK